MAVYVGEIILVGFNFAPTGYASCNGQLLPIAENETLFQLIGTTYGGDGVSTFAVPDLRGRVPLGYGAGSGSSYAVGDAGGTESVSILATQLPGHSHPIDSSGLTASARCRNGAANQVTPVGDLPAIESVPPFTDPSLTAESTVMRAVHITELRSRIDAMRARFSLGAFAYTTPVLTAGTTIAMAQHIVDLRAALAAVYIAAGIAPQPSYTDPNLVAGTPIKAVHVAELRSAVFAVPGGGALGAPYSSAAPDANMNSGAVVVSGTATAAPIGSSLSHENRQPYLVMNFCISLFGIFPSQS